MRRPLSLLPALLAVAATATGLTPGPVHAAPAAPAAPATPATPATATAVAAAAEEQDPLQVRIDTLTPAVVPARGRVRMRGTVTNTSDERWRAINVHAFMAASPLTSAGELAEATGTPVDAEVGARITIPGTFDSVGSLDPGQTVAFDVRLRRDQLPAAEPGVYWFGAHALGNTDAPRDGVADGRARTFLPLVPPGAGDADPVATSLVLPVRRAVRHRPNGRLRTPERWARDLRNGGRLVAPLDLATAPGAGPVTWLVDPAVPDAVARLAAGNPRRSLAGDPDQDPADPDAPEEPEEPAPSGTAEPVDGEAPGEPTANPAAEPGAAWLSRLEAALAADEVLTLPYGDTDLAAAAAHAPDFYDRAVVRTGTQLDRWQTPTTPAVASSSGYLSRRELRVLQGTETVLAADVALADGGPAAPARIAGHRVVLTSPATATGGPGPEDPLGAIALRQRILAEAALRLLFHDRAPLVVVVPTRFRPSEPEQFWEGLDTEWLELTDVADLRADRTVPAAELAYPEEEAQARLDATAFGAAESLISAGRTLEGLLTDNDSVADEVLDEALVSVSHHERSRPVEARIETLRATQWIRTRLGNVRIQVPRGVTLASASGNFAATLSNRLPHPVTVSITAVSEGAVTVEPPANLQLAPRGRQTVVLQATAASPGVHYVRLQVTDAEGNPIGAAQQVPIRSAQVSQVIWLILGVGVALLFLAITRRVVRRVRSEPT